MSASPPARDPQTNRVIRKRKPALHRSVCRICNHFQYCDDYEEVHARDGRRTSRTQIWGDPGSYVIRIHTNDLLRDGGDVEDTNRLRNCPYCRLLYDALNLFFNDASLNWISDAKTDLTRNVRVKFQRGSPLILQCEDAIQYHFQFTYIRSDVEIFSADWGNMAPSDFPTARLTPPTAELGAVDKKVEGFLQYWFRGCAGYSDATDQCYNTPNRLLYVDCYTDEIKLWECESEVPGMPELYNPMDYATLSHCWLDDDPMLPKLLTSNIEEWRQGRTISGLPAAVRDAAKVANLNDVNFLFIDSLCIVQDSQEDLDAQRPMVGYYFRDSILTIVAAASPSPDDEFLYPPERDWTTKTVDFKAPSGASTTLTMRKRFSRPVSPSDAVDEASTLSHVSPGSFRRTGPLYARHWCLQEALLGTRVVHFTSAGIMWDCKRHDCTREGVRVYKRPEVFRGLPARSRLRNDLDMWLEAVQFHTSCDQLPGKDRLSAISALAAMSEMGIIDRYVAGLWWGNMTMGLLWEVKLRPGQTNTTKITMPYSVQKAPSFSWASVDAPVIFQDNFRWYFSPEARMIGGGSLPQRADDPCGNVDGAWIRLEAYMKKCEVSQTLGGAAGGHWQFVYCRNTDGTTTKMHPFVGDGSLVVVKGKKATSERLRRKRASRAKRRLRKKQSGAEDDNPNHSHAYLARNHFEFRRNMVGPGKITGVAWVLCVRRRGQFDEEEQGIKYDRFDGLVLTRSMRYPGAFERIGCIRNVPSTLLDFSESRQEITLV
ncbi:hypothetical protein BBK36DRAFT_1207039 [Trichoderma citrinoviride]|uniref:Heterokaryon incompatibility domain-containing protein n=1 Tax=Trichoderma citrinoviride TaxID=58853 RepID=A0A2T4BMI4_9HYPO|nr:hypothetical protein BBK36DRAFT_1207039 [Trichoderma citrinoviride]PTB70479.1 hypothetical protein BBK36DRAFT_1207039 [Trichoderma citrinoviride]